MSQFLDPVNLIFLGIAVLVFWRLKSVLGTGARQHKSSAEILRQPKSPAQSKNAVTSRQSVAADRNTEEGSPLANGLQQIVIADPKFDVSAFLDGALAAYELIITSFADGNKKTLQNLLSEDIYFDFSRDIDLRNARQQIARTNLVRVEDISIVSAEVEGENALITVKITADLITFVSASDHRIISGDPKLVNRVEDIWTFQRNVKSKDPNWQLSATSSTNNEA